MPSTLESLAVFAAAIAPGYGLISGYQHQRSYSAPERDLYVLAQAFVGSAVWIALTWWPMGHSLTQWATRGALADHEFVAWLMACLFLALPYIIGRLLGQILRSVATGSPRGLFKALVLLGAYEPPTLWDYIWEQVRRRNSSVLVVRLKDGGVIEGQFAAKSRVDLSPHRPRLFLERAYGYDSTGRRIVFPLGAYIEGSEIVGVQFRS